MNKIRLTKHFRKYKNLIFVVKPYWVVQSCQIEWTMVTCGILVLKRLIHVAAWQVYSECWWQGNSSIKIRYFWIVSGYIKHCLCVLSIFTILWRECWCSWRGCRCACSATTTHRSTPRHASCRRGRGFCRELWGRCGTWTLWRCTWGCRTPPRTSASCRPLRRRPGPARE